MRRPLVLAAVVGAAALGAVVARADGDPASDVLLYQNLFLPTPRPPAAPSAALRRAVARANSRGRRLKVALIASKVDLGSDPSLFNRPREYARFLGTELSAVYNGPLLVVMPRGLALYRHGRFPTRAARVLAAVEPRPSRGALAATAAQAVERLTRARLVAYEDVHPPYAYPVDATARRGQVVGLRFTILDDSGRSRAVVRVYGKGSRVLAKLTRPMSRITVHFYAVVNWRVPRSVAAGKLRFCVVPTDPYGNVGRPGCARIAVR